MLQRCFFGYLLISAVAGAMIAGLLLSETSLRAKITAKWRRIVWIALAMILVIPFGLIPKPEETTVMLPDMTMTLTGDSHKQSVPLPVRSIASQVSGMSVPEVAAEHTAVVRPYAAPDTLKTAVPVWKAAMMIWAAGAALVFGIKILFYLRFKAALSKAEPADVEISDAAKRLAEEQGIKPVPVAVSKNAPSPLAIGFFKPVIFLPDENTDGLALILRHELTHLKKGDLRVKALLIAANALHWFNPAVWLMNKKAAQDIEFACDDEALRGLDTQQRRLYGHIILKTASEAGVRTDPSLSTCFAGGEKTMKERIQNIFNTTAKRSGAVLAAVLIMVSAVAGGLIGCRADGLSESEIRALFDKAEAAYSWFTPYNEFPAGDSLIHLEGDDYYNVAIDGVKSKDRLKAYIQTVFSDEIAVKLMDECVRPLAEENGALYFKAGVVTEYPYGLGDRNYKIKKQSENKIVWLMKADYEGYAAEYEYVLEREADGNWKFTAFDLPAALLLRARANGAKKSVAQTPDPVLDLIKNPVIEPAAGKVVMTGGEAAISLFMNRYADSMITLEMYDYSDICADTSENATMVEYIRYQIAFLRAQSMNWPDFEITAIETFREQNGNALTVRVAFEQSHENAKTGTRAVSAGYEWEFVLDTSGKPAIISSVKELPPEYKGGGQWFELVKGALKATGLPLETPQQIHNAGDEVIRYFYKNGTLPREPGYLMADGVQTPADYYVKALSYTDKYHMIHITPEYSYGITTVGLADKNGKVIFDVNCKGIGVTENGYFILCKDDFQRIYGDVYIVVGPDGYEAGRFHNLSCHTVDENGTSAYYEASAYYSRPVAPYEAMKKYMDGTEEFWLLDERFQPIGSSYDSLIVTDEGAAATRDGAYYQLDKSGNVIIKKEPGVIKTFFGKYQLTVRYISGYNSNAGYGLLDKNGKTIFEQIYCQIEMPFEDRAVLFTGNDQSLYGRAALLADAGGNILNTQYNIITYLVTKDGYIGIARSFGPDSEAEIGCEEAGCWLVDRDGNPVSGKYRQIGNSINEPDGLLYTNSDDTASPLIFQSEDGVKTTVPLSEMLIKSH